VADTVSVTGTGVLMVATAGATLSGAGEVYLAGDNEIKGLSSTATLTNDGRILGAGEIGGGEMALTNGSGAYIESYGSDLLTIDTVGNTIVNAGVIEAVGAGGATITSAVNNSGRLIAYSSLLTVEGAVTGSGYGQVDSGTLDFTSSFSQNVTFISGSTGTLELAKSQSYGGKITGFSTSGANALDLTDIAFVSPGQATFAGTSSGGTLTVTDGTHTAKITLTGDYLNSTFVASSDGHGGTKVVDPPAAAPLHAFIAAAAAMGAVGGPVVPPAESTGSAPSFLVAARSQLVNGLIDS
jgi:hypothetical protein